MPVSVDPQAASPPPPASPGHAVVNKWRGMGRSTISPVTAFQKPLELKTPALSFDSRACRYDPKADRRKVLRKIAAKKANPRRADSHGHRSLEFTGTKPGITNEAFLRAGGRRMYLAWDIKEEMRRRRPDARSGLLEQC